MSSLNKAAVCWYLVHRQADACSYSTLILTCANSFLTGNFIVNYNTHFFIRKVIFLNTSFISALMIVVNLCFFSSLNQCFVYLRFQWTCLWRIGAFKEEKNYEQLVLAFVLTFVSVVLNVIVFVYNGSKQSLIFFLKKIRSLHCTEIARNTWGDFNSFHYTWNQVDLNILVKTCVCGVDSTLTC